MAGRFIKLYDKILNWEWYHDTNTFRLFIHLLLKANYKDMTFQGQVIRRGQFVTSLTSLAAGTALSIRQVRVSLDKLQMTGEVTSKAYPKYRVITIVRYDDYQSNDKQNDKQMTSNTASKWQANDKQDDKQHGSQMSREMTTSIEYIEPIEYRNIEQIEESRGKTAKRFIPPTKDQIEIFCLENGLSIDVDRFVNYYTANGWMVGKNKMKDWQATVRNWSSRSTGNSPALVQRKQPEKKVTAQDYEQRDYTVIQNEIERRQAERIMARLRMAGDD